jgi:hypothetical protein
MAIDFMKLKEMERWVQGFPTTDISIRYKNMKHTQEV